MKCETKCETCANYQMLKFMPPVISRRDAASTLYDAQLSETKKRNSNVIKTLVPSDFVMRHKGCIFAEKPARCVEYKLLR